MVNSFSGTHPYRPQCVIDSIVADFVACDFDTRGPATERAAQITERIDAGECPRCLAPLPDGDPERPAGSRVTACRCIPICGRCGSDETYQSALGRPMSRAWQWPVRKGAITRRRREIETRLAPTRAEMTTDSAGAPVLLTEDGVTPVVLRPPSSGGWAQYGYDDSADAQERKG